MDHHQPYSVPLSFPYSTAPLSRNNSSILQSFSPHQQTASAQRIHRQQERQWHANTANTQSTFIPSGIASAEQSTAIASIQGISIPTILDWLENLRSSPHGEPSCSLNPPPPQHLKALSTLIYCPNELVHTWLNAARSPRAFTLLPDLQGNDILSDGSATAVSVSQSPSTFDVTPGTPWDQESYKPSRDASVGVQSSSAATSNRYDRWCFICEDLKRITTHDGLQKHVLKHFTKHYCIPSNSVMQTEDGPKCAICRVSDPDPRHLNTHTECLNKTFTTRDNLIKHLESKHKFHDASVLAKHAKHTTINQKYFACGFCGFCCDSLNKQVNHVDAIHYKYSAHRSDWDQNTVIRGLLSQPDVHEHWQWFLGANLHLQEPGLKWNPTQIKHLQRRLELGQEDAVVLCQAAISAIDDRSYGRSQQGLVDSAPFAGFRDLDRDTGQSIQTLNREDTSFPLAYSSEQRPLSYVLPMTAPIPSQNLGRKILNHVNQDTNSKAAPSPDVASEGYRWPIHSGYGPAGRHAQTWNSPHVTQYHPPTPTSSSASASDISPAMEGQAQTVRSSGSRGYLPGKSPNVVKHPQSRQEVVTHSYPSQGQVGLPHTTLTTQSASSPLYPIYEAPSLGLLNSAYSPRPHLTLTAPFPQEETTDYHGINMDHGTGSPQRFLQDQHRIKRQRGKR